MNVIISSSSSISTKSMYITMNNNIRSVKNDNKHFENEIKTL